MSTVIDKIYNYFERDPELKVLFIFNDEFLAIELEEAQWKEGYRYVDSKETGSLPSTSYIRNGLMIRLYSISISHRLCR